MPELIIGRSGFLDSVMVQRPPHNSLPRSIADLAEPRIREDLAYRLPECRVVFADHRLLQRDFPSLHFDEPGTGEPCAETRRRIDRWLVRHAGLVSITQAAQSRVNTPIPTLPQPLRVYRPPRYGRAFVVALEEMGEPEDGDPAKGLLDVKGAGVRPGRTPHHGAHGDGLLRLGEAFEEYLTQRLVEAVLRHAGSPVRSLPVYAILDLGFCVVSETGARFPAGALVRRGHRRNPGGRELPSRGSAEQAKHFEIEMLLRHYGLTSANPGTATELIEEDDGTIRYRFAGKEVRGFAPELLRALWDRVGRGRRIEFDGINIQTLRSLSPDSIELVDFGQFKVRERFDNPVLSLVHNRPFRWGGVLYPDDPAFVQPRPELAVPAEDWGDVELTRDKAAALGFAPDEVLSRKEEIGLRLAWELRAGRCSGEEVRDALHGHVAATVARWPGSGFPMDPVDTIATDNRREGLGSTAYEVAPSSAAGTGKLR